MAIIEVNHVSKEFRLGKLFGAKQSAIDAWNRLRGRPSSKPSPFKALDDVTFSLDAGEVVGIIGQNGAGKSTLLKILSGITSPSNGFVRVNGKVAPLIEVGAGLNPEMTGRENIYLNAAILGIPRRDIKTKIGEIVSFSELEEFIDTPIKRYSSGMKVRLGFAIATSIHAEILIVDEVLAVGDMAFQRKCFERMEDLIKRQGNTVLLVSHNIRQVERLCSRVILLDRGRVLSDGEPAKVCGEFFQRSNDKVNLSFLQSESHRKRVRSSGELDLDTIEILDQHASPVEEIDTGDMLRIRVSFLVNQLVRKPEIVVGTHTTDFVYLTANSTASIAGRPDFPPGTHTVECIIPSYPLKDGVYCIRIAVFDQYRRMIFSGDTLKMFSVRAKSGETREAPLRLINVEAQWDLPDIQSPAELPNRMETPAPQS